MYQNNRGSYRKKETLTQQFLHSCLGQLIIATGIIGAVLIVAHITRPSISTMETEMRDNVRQCIEERDSLSNDWIDDIVSNIGYIFTHADTLQENNDMMKQFDKWNKLQYNQGAFITTVNLRNNLLPEGKRCGMGLFGLVVPMLNYNDLLLNEELMRSDTLNQRLININTDGDYLGDNPGLEPYRFQGE